MSENAWTEWHGGKCPVPADALVGVRLRCGDEDKMEAINFDWLHRSDESPEYDIIAYRIAGEPEMTPTDKASSDRPAISLQDGAGFAASGPRYRHVKRGTAYEVIGTASLQIATNDIVDGSDLVIYRGDDGQLWAREEGEFHDGRFEPIAPVEDKPATAVEAAAHIVTVADYNSVFDPADEAGRDAYTEGFREGWIFAQTPDGSDYDDVRESYGRAVDIEPSEAWYGYRDEWFKHLPLAALPTIGSALIPNGEAAGTAAPVSREAVARAAYWADVKHDDETGNVLDEWRDSWWKTNADMPLSGKPFLKRWFAIADAIIALLSGGGGR